MMLALMMAWECIYLQQFWQSGGGLFVVELVVSGGGIFVVKVGGEW